MTKIGIIIDRPLRESLFLPRDLERLKEAGTVEWTDSGEPLTEDEAIALLKDCEVALGSWRSPVPSAAVLDACPHLRLWEHVAGSVKRMFGPHLKGRDLTIASCKGAIADCVAEMVIGLLVTGFRKVYENVEANRRGKSPKPEGMKVLCCSTVGVVGASEVGRRVVAHLRHFGARILLYDPFVTADQARVLGVERVDDLVSLCAGSDAVTLHTPLLPSTRKMMGAAAFQAMPDGALFINTSRGGCVDEAALVSELGKGRLTAFLDVSDPEPPAEESPLRKLPNVYYTSHIAGPATFNMGRQAVDDVLAFLRGDAPDCVITEDMLDRIA